MDKSSLSAKKGHTEFLTYLQDQIERQGVFVGGGGGGNMWNMYLFKKQSLVEFHIVL